MKTSDLKLAMEDLIEVLDLTDDETGKTLRPEKDLEKLKKQIVEAVGLVEPSDVLEESTIEVLKELGAWADDKKEEPEEDGKEEKVEKSLEEQIEEIDDLDELKDLVEEEVKFKPLRKKLATYKKLSVLKGIMYDLLEDDEDKKEKDEETPDEDDEKPKSKKTKVKDDEDDEPKKPVRKPAEKPVKEKKEEIKNKKDFTRMDAVGIALKTKKPKTIQEWVDGTNEIYGVKNDSESKMMIRYASKILNKFDISHPAKW